jgi:hypothetical protein
MLGVASTGEHDHVCFRCHQSGSPPRVSRAASTADGGLTWASYLRRGVNTVGIDRVIARV